MMTIRHALALTAALLAPAAAQAVTYDAFSSFTGINGAGRFFYSMTPVSGGSGAPLTPGGSGCVISGSVCLQAGGGLPGVYKSSTPSVQYGSVNVPADRLLLHPGAAQNILTTFIAPATATYYLKLSVNVQDTSPSGVNLFRFTNEGGTPAGGALGSLGSSNLAQTFTGSVTLVAGQYVGFGINPGASYNNDSIGVNFLVSDSPLGVPEPTAWALMVGGFGLLGAAVRRRRAAQRARAARPFPAHRLAALSLAAIGTGASAAPVTWAGNGHSYDVVYAVNPSWGSAFSAAGGMTFGNMSGYLATFTTRAEQEFVIGALGGGSALNALWLGATQSTLSSDYSEPYGGWRWITGEAWLGVSVNDPLKPRSDFGFNNSYFDGSAEGYAITWWNSGGINDYTAMPNPLLGDANGGAARGFIVEFGAVPEPATWAMLLGGFAFCGRAARRRRRAFGTVCA